ncbi:MAG: chemotaxis protein CheD [Planctomycetota bacterium]|jgi:chemotaxis protein CheD
MKKIIDVQIGQVKAGEGKVVLKSKAIGSCIAIAAYDSRRNVGALAHVMLPGRAPASKAAVEKTKYAADAIEMIVNKMAELGSENADIDVVLVGGGNVLDRKDDTICTENVESAQELLRERNLEVRAKSVGGTSRRSISLDVEDGIVSYTKGNNREKELWRASMSVD